MHTELLRQSPLLALPLAATFLFLAVWLFAALRAMTRPRAEVAALARLPLEGEDGPAPGARRGGDHGGRHG